MAEKTQFDLSNRLFTTIIVFVISIVGLAGVAAYGIWDSVENENDTLTVEGQGKAYMSPDMAYIDVGVTADAETSEEAVEEGSKKMENVTEALKSFGVEEKDIQTTNYSVYPKYKWIPLDQTNVEDGFTFSQSVKVRIRDFEKIGEGLAEVTKAGANLVGGVYFDIENNEKVKAEARKKAVEDARKKAEAISEETGIRLGKVVNFWESGGDVFYGKGGGGMAYQEERAMSMDAALPTANIAPPVISPGEQEVIMSVSLTYEIR